MKKIINFILELFKEFITDWKLVLFTVLLIVLVNVPVNYYITIGGGASDVSSRIKVANKHESKGSFNISYVTQLDGSVFTYLLSYIIPSWEREDANLYKYDEKESLEDVEFRSDLDLMTANGNATYWAYHLANKQIEEKTSKMYIITTFDSEFNSPLKVQDQILSMDDVTYDTIADYRTYLQTKELNDKVKVKVIRDGKEKVLECPLYEENGHKILGVGLQFVREYKTKPTVEINFKSRESGPSGGLITTLEIYNQLTEKDLTKGKKIAGTGTIEEDGTIGQIGGIEHKILGAYKAGAEVFLSPSGKNYKAAKKYIKEKKIKIKLIEATNIEETIKKLEELK